MDENNNNANSSAMLESMNLDELKDLRRKLDRAIKSYETRKRQEALSVLEQAARDHGFKLADLVSDGKPGKGRKPGAETPSSPVRYANPENPEQTWSGRGRRPRWVNDAVGAGRSLDDLAA